jgi:hypothetical protein
VKVASKSMTRSGDWETLAAPKKLIFKRPFWAPVDISDNFSNTAVCYIPPINRCAYIGRAEAKDDGRGDARCRNSPDCIND